MKTGNKLYIYMVVIAVLALINFYPVFNNDFSLDDAYYKDQVADIQTWDDVWKVTERRFSEIDYRPLPSLTFAVEKVMMGELKPSMSHGINWVIYVFCAWLLMWFVHRLPEAWQASKIAPIAGILFTVLPLHTSMVANIKCRDGLMSFLFGIIFLHGVLTIFKSESWDKKAIAAVVSFGSIYAAMYSKLDGLNFLLLSPIVAVLYYKQIQWKQVLRFSILGLLSYQFLTYLFDGWFENRNQVLSQTNSPGDPIIFTENPIVQSEQLTTSLAFSIQTVFEYIVMVFRPFGHYFYFGYDMVPVLPLTSLVIWLKAGFILFWIVLAIFLFHKQRLASFGILFFFICLVYCSNLVTPVAGIIADRYAFIASAGACLSLAVGIHYLSILLFERYFKRENHPPVVAKGVSKKGTALPAPSKFRQPATVALSLTILLALVYLPFNRVRSAEWKNFFTLFEADMPDITHRSYEGNRIALKNYVERGIDSDDPQLRAKYFAKGLEYGQNAVNIYDAGVLVQEGLVMALYGLDNFDAAVAQARYVIERFDSSEVAWRILTEYYNSNKKTDSAALGYRRLIDLVPKDPNVYLFYVTTLQQAGQTDRALEYCDSLLADTLFTYLPNQAKAYLYLNVKDSANAVLNIEKGFEKGWRDQQMLDIVGIYWWSRDKEKWEEMKRYAQ